MSMQRTAVDLFDVDPLSLKPQSVAEARELDRLAIEELAIPSILLMENAARGLSRQARTMLDQGDLLILAGKGNNGGDGLALARLLAPRARVALLGLPDPETCPDAALQLTMLRLAGIRVDLAPDRPLLDQLVDSCDLLVDALLGTGQSSAPRGLVADWIRWMNARPEPILAADLPSGFDADRGEGFDPCVQATATVSFARPKKGFFRGTECAPELGRLRISSIGLPEPWVEQLQRETD